MGRSGCIDSKDLRALLGCVRVRTRGRTWPLPPGRADLTWHLSETLKVKRGGDSRMQSAIRSLVQQRSRASPWPHQASRLVKYFYLTRSNFRNRVVGKNFNKHLEIASLTLESPSASLMKLVFQKPISFFKKKLFVLHPHYKKNSEKQNEK